MHPSKIPSSNPKAQRRKAILRQDTAATAQNNSVSSSSEKFNSDESTAPINSGASADRDLYKKQPIQWEKYSFYIAVATPFVAFIWYLASQYFVVANLQDDTKLIKAKTDGYDKFQVVTEMRLNQVEKSISALESKKGSGSVK